MLFQIRRQGDAADPLDDQAGEQEVGVAIEKPLARRKIGGALAADARQQILGGAGHAEIHAALAHDLQHVAQAGHVAQDHINADGAEIRQFRQMLANVVRQRQPAIAHQFQHRRTGELLADRGDAEPRCRADLHAMLDAGEAGAAMHREVAVQHHADGGTWCGAVMRRQQLVHPAFEPELIEIHGPNPSKPANAAASR